MQCMGNNKSRRGTSKARKSSVFIDYSKSMYAAFKYDTEAFLQKFEKENSLNYANFTNVWHSMNFTFVFADQHHAKLLKILCELCFVIVKKYIIFQTSQYIQIGAFYLLYGLYYKQPVNRSKNSSFQVNFLNQKIKLYRSRPESTLPIPHVTTILFFTTVRNRHLVKIRLTLDEYKKIKSLMNEMQSKGQYDALYIFAKMKSDGAFTFVAHPKPLSIFTKYNVFWDANDTFTNRGCENSLYKFQNLLKDEAVQTLSNTCEAYDAKLKAFSESHPGLVPFKSTIMKDLEDIYRIAEAKNSADSDDEMQPKMMPKNARQTAKQKALANKNAQYRGSRKVITAIDLDEESESD